jgi:cytochrome c biogenesis protein
MAGTFATTARKAWQTLGAIKTGVVLLILTVVLSAAGTVILQRPMMDPEDMQRAYSPSMLRLLDALGLTDVFHAWWFVSLLVLVSMSILAASIQRFPNAWRYYARPYKSTDETFRRALQTQAQIEIENEESGLAVAERVLRREHLAPERIVGKKSFSLFAERNRISEMAVYLVHASLLLIFFGGIVDATFGWKGSMSLEQGQELSKIDLRDGGTRALPFSVRCYAAGRENYSDGSPKSWWSDLAVVSGGRDVLRKKIVVNDPLVYQGARFYQSSYGETGKLDSILFSAAPAENPDQTRDIALHLNETVQLDPDTSVRIAEFIPDYVVSDGQVYSRSKELGNPAVHLVVSSKKAGNEVNYWLPPIENFEQNASSPYQFSPKDLKMGYFTGLQVTHEPGQWAVWSGVLLMGLGLACVFYLVHTRIWVVPVHDQQGSLKLWIGGTANRNRDVFEQRFRTIVEEIEKEVKQKPQLRVEARQMAQV